MGTFRDMVVYDLANVKYLGKVLKFPLGILFLVDYHLTWRFNEARLRGDIATNISCGPAMLMGVIGRIAHAFGIKKRVA